MTASEVIERLKELIEKEGDLEVCIRAGDLSMLVTSIETHRIVDTREKGAPPLEYFLFE